MILFLMPNKPLLTNKTIIHHNILRHPDNHKHKHHTEMNILSLMKIIWFHEEKIDDFSDQSDDEGNQEKSD